MHLGHHSPTHSKMKVLVVLVGLVCCALAKPSFNPRPRVIHGKKATKGEFPYQVSYQWGLKGTNQHTCGGSIISETWVLTAGHCVTMVPTIGDHIVVAGILNLNDKNAERQEINVAELISHPEFENAVGPNDVGLLKLESPLEFGELVQPISLPAAGTVPLGDAILTGWGSVSTIIIPIMPVTLQKSTIPVLDNTECNKVIEALVVGDKNPYSLESNICTGPIEEHAGACSGDSGGPLVQDNAVVGIVSWGMSPCGHKGAPSVFTKVSNFVDFIQEQTGVKAGKQ